MAIMKAVKGLVRRAVYATPARLLLPKGAKPEATKEYWDQELAGRFAPYLGGTVSVECRDAITLALLRMIVPEAKSLLDIGCASGSLGRAPGAERYTYVGTDISKYAIDQARELSPERCFHCADLKSFMPAQQFDVICFNEVLYYLPLEEGVKQLDRYASYLLDRGVFVIEMKNDPKSAAIFRLVGKSFDWINGILYQEKKQGYSYQIKTNAARPGYLLGVFAVKRSVMRHFQQ